MKSLLLILAALLFGSAAFAQTPVNPVIDTSACSVNQSINYQGPSSSLGCTAAAATPNSKGQYPSMGGGTGPSTFYVPTTSGAAINSTSDTSCFSSTGVNTQTITVSTSPQIPYVANSFRMRCGGTITTTLATVGTLTVKVKWGSVTVTSITTPGLAVNISNAAFRIEAECTIRSISATPSASTIICSGELKLASGLAVTIPQVFASAAPVSVDTTTNVKPDLTLSWSSIVGSPTAVGTEGSYEILY